MFTCPFCDSKFEDVKLFRKHDRDEHVHDKSLKPVYRCKENNCFAEYESSLQFTRHLKGTHLNFLATANKSTESSRFVFNDSADFTSPSSEILNSSDEINTETENVTETNNLIEMTSVAGSSNSIDVSQDLKKISGCFLGSFYKNSTLPRKIVQDVVESTTEYLCNVVNKFQTLNLTKEEKYEAMIKFLNDPFVDLKSERKRIKFYKENKNLILPVRYILGQRDDVHCFDHSSDVESKNCTGEFIPMRDVLKAVFECSNLYEMSRYYLINDSDESNFVNSTWWKSIVGNSNEQEIYPLFVYFDDFDPLNALHSHAGIYSLGAVYFTLLNWPIHFRTKLDHIFLALIFHTEDRKRYGNEVTFSPLISELKFLAEEGIIIRVGNLERRVFFRVGIFAGDNLGIHAIFGFAGSFTANYPCRFCKIRFEEINTSITEDVAILRTKKNYLEDVATNNLTLTGVQSNSVFNEIPHFHVVENSMVEPEHDELEGSLRYDMALIVQFLIDKRNITLEDLNRRIQFFNYGPFVKNVVPSVTPSHLKNHKIIFSAAEMKYFVTHFSLLLFDLIPNIDKKLWNFYLICKEMMEISFSQIIEINEEIVNHFKDLVKLHHTYYKELFPNVSLKPKHHFLSHYASKMEKVGRLNNVHVLRGEARHRIIKDIAESSKNHINIPYTVAIKNQLMLSETLNSEERFDLNKIVPIAALKKINVKKLECYFEIYRRLPESFFPEVYRTNELLFQGIKFREDCVIQLEGSPSFGLIKVILINIAKNSFLFVVQKLKTISFREETAFFEVEIDRASHLLLISKEDLMFINCFHLIKICDFSYFVIASKYDVK